MDGISIESFLPSKNGGYGYKLQYYVPVPINDFWQFKTDFKSILTVSTTTSLVRGVTDVSISLPDLVGGNGIIETLSLPLNSGEAEELKRSEKIKLN
jgi:hypothetical protein